MTKVCGWLNPVVTRLRRASAKRRAANLWGAFGHLSAEVLETRALLSVGHGGNTVMQTEHDNVMKLMPDAAVTNKAIASGSWEQDSTWEHGVPISGDNVLIPVGFSVSLNSVNDAPLRTL